MDKMPWPTVVLASVGFAVIGVLLALNIPIANIIAAFSIAGNVVSLLVYGKVSKVETNTNGTAAKHQALIEDLVNYVKTSVPVDAVVKKDE